VELRHLRYFVALAEVLHFGRAAAQLGIAQPSLSEQIRQLEDELQTLLLRRTKRRVELTGAGRALLEEARQILSHADRAALIARRTGRGELATLRVGTAPWIDSEKILQAISAFSTENPGIHIDLRTMNHSQQVEAVRHDRLDVGFVRPPVDQPSVTTETLVREPFVVGLPAGHRLARRGRIGLSSLESEPFVFIRRDAVPVFYDLMLKVCGEAGFVPHVPHEADHPQVVLGLVAAGMGLSLVPEWVQKIKPQGVVLRPLRPSPRIVQSGLVWRSENTSPLLIAFLEVARRVLIAVWDDDPQKRVTSVVRRLRRGKPHLRSQPATA
jgi:DNA-binding transcriptional LysR family regulator